MEGCNLDLLLGFMARLNYHCDHGWMSQYSQPHPHIMQRVPAPPSHYAERTLYPIVMTVS